MHSRIFCIVSKTLEEKEQEICKENFEDLSETEVFEDFQSIADYVSEDTNFSQDCEWLKEYGERSGVIEFIDDTTFKFNRSAVEEVLEDRIKKLKEKVDTLNSAKDLQSWTVYEIGNILNDKFSFHFMLDDRYSTYTFDELLVEICQGTESCLEYKIVKSFDYHY